MVWGRASFLMYNVVKYHLLPKNPPKIHVTPIFGVPEQCQILAKNFGTTKIGASSIFLWFLGSKWYLPIFLEGISARPQNMKGWFQKLRPKYQKQVARTCPNFSSKDYQNKKWDYFFCVGSIPKFVAGRFAKCQYLVGATIWRDKSQYFIDEAQNWACVNSIKQEWDVFTCPNQVWAQLFEWNFSKCYCILLLCIAIPALPYFLGARIGMQRCWQPTIVFCAILGMKIVFFQACGKSFVICVH